MSGDGPATQAAHQIEKLIRVHFRNSYRDGLRPAQWQALRYFAAAKPAERSLTAFARHRRSTMGTASMTVSQLVERGFLERGDPEGQRNIGLRITDKGWRALENDPMKDLVAAIADLDSSRVETLAEALDDIAKRLDDSYVTSGSES